MKPDLFALKATLLMSLLVLITWSCKEKIVPPGTEFACTEIHLGDQQLNLANAVLNKQLPVDKPLQLTFNYPLQTDNIESHITLTDASGTVLPLQFSFQSQDLAVDASPADPLSPQQSYTIDIASTLKNKDGVSCKPLSIAFETQPGQLKIDSIVSGGIHLIAPQPAQNVNRNFVASVYFNHALTTSSVTNANVLLYRQGVFEQFQLAFANGDSTLVITASTPLAHFEKYSLYLGSTITGQGGYILSDFSKSFYTAIDPAPKFPVVSDEALMDLVQEGTFRYFWDFGHPVSGLARERNTSGDIVTSGGSGFGLMAIIVGVERGFITREQGVERWQKIVSFLKNNAQRYHGAWPHWLNGASGATVPFSTKDNGADLVETSYLIQGLLTVRQYLNPADPGENALAADIQELWEGVEWDWFTRGGQDVLYWHWSPNYGWEMNHQIRGYNECLITYFLAACSPTHPIVSSVYHNGWAQSGNIINNNTYYGYNLPLGYAYGGPLFFAHYSYLGLDPRYLEDNYANYWDQNRQHTLINRAYCIANPLNKVGYSASCWGLTASDNHVGYNAHSPTNDLGVITPTAALSSFPYTPEYSMEALKFFYYTLGDKLWGDYGLVDAFNVTEGWYGDSYLAIDQGPIIVMMENHRTGKLWDLFMSSPEVATGAAVLGFTY